MRALKKTLIAAALVSAGISSIAESNQPVYWPAMAMMPVQFGNQVAMVPVSGWITPHGFLPAFAPGAGQPALAGAQPPQYFFPPAPTPPFPGMAAPGMMLPPHNVSMQPGMPYAVPLPGQVQMPAQFPVPAHARAFQGGTTASAPGMLAPGMAAPRMVMPGLAGGASAPMLPPINQPLIQQMPQQARHLPTPGMMPLVPVMQPPAAMGTAMDAMRYPATARAPEAAVEKGVEKGSDKAITATVASVSKSTSGTSPGAESAAAVSTAALPAATSPAEAGGALQAEPKTPETPALRTDAAMVSVPVAGSVSPRDVVASAKDRDGDGVTNDVDLCPDKSGAAGSLGCPSDEGITLGGVTFRYDSDELTDESKEILDRLAQKLARLKGAKLEVAGHTDARGDAMYNLDLSERRARAVREYLVEQGVGPSRLIAKGYGQARPLADNESREGRATNRRVELRPV